jgi:hypothetical protein
LGGAAGWGELMRQDHGRRRHGGACCQSTLSYLPSGETALPGRSESDDDTCFGALPNRARMAQPRPEFPDAGGP